MKSITFKTIMRILFREGESEKNILFINKALRAYKNIVDAAKIFQPYQSFWILNEIRHNKFLSSEEINALILRCLEDSMSSFWLLFKCDKMLDKKQKSLAALKIQQDPYAASLSLIHNCSFTNSQKERLIKIIKKDLDSVSYLQEKIPTKWKQMQNHQYTCR